MRGHVESCSVLAGIARVPLYSLTYLLTCAEVDRDVEQEEDIETSRDVVERVGGGLAEVRLETDLVILVVRSIVVVSMS